MGSEGYTLPSDKVIFPDSEGVLSFVPVLSDGCWAVGGAGSWDVAGELSFFPQPVENAVNRAHKHKSATIFHNVVFLITSVLSFHP
jgi:hypothetical protein